MRCVASEGVRRRFRREHGFQLPLHPLQVSGWLALTALSAASYLLLVPGLPHHFQTAAIASLTVLLLVHVAAHLGAALVDPAEPQLRRTSPSPLPELDRTKHPHVIEDGHCNLCRLEISTERTKHCSACNKCVAHFDHHCKWLNHCVGGRNYAPFFMCVSTAVAAAILVAVLAICEVVFHNHTSDWLPKANSTAPLEQTGFAYTGNDVAFLFVVGAIGVLAVVTAGLLLHLCFFHVYISFLGLTTYEYIRQQRQQAAVSVVAEPSEDASHRCPSIRHRPMDLLCDKRSQITAVFTCSVVERSCGNCMAEPTPTPPSTPDDCHMCMLVSNSIAPEPIQQQQKVSAPPIRKVKRRWNCCVSVPDSPDDPHSPGEQKCLMNLCKYKIGGKSNGTLAALESRSHRTHGHWSSAKIRVLFRVIGNLGHNRRRSHVDSTARNNQVSPLNGEGPIQQSVHTISDLIPATYPTPIIAEDRRSPVLPVLPPPPRRRMFSETELADALAMLQHQRALGRRPLPQYRRRRRSTTHRPKTPALSPIRESGLSNPASPSRQSCAVAAIPGSCIRPF